MNQSVESGICLDTCTNEELVVRVKEQMQGSRQLAELSDLFKVLGDCTRIRILNALQMSELCVCDLVSILEMNQSAISHQLRVLRSSKIVKHRKVGRNVYYSLDDDHVHQLIQQGLDHVLED